MSAVFVIGDLHGQVEKFTRLLRDAGLVGADLRWRGADATLWLIGDFTDRGPDGIGVIDLTLRLTGEAAVAGGQVRALLGNHDVLIVAARRFGSVPNGGPGGAFRSDWEENGGNARDLERLTAAHAAWLIGLPAMARAGDHLLAHADTLLYDRYGHTVDEINAAIAALLAGSDTFAWDRLLGEFSDDRLFRDPDGGAARAESFLDRFGARQLVHGHTPIPRMTGQPPERVTGPHLYAGGRCLNVDGGMYLGGPGFVWRMPDP